MVKVSCSMDIEKERISLGIKAAEEGQLREVAGTFEEG